MKRSATWLALGLFAVSTPAWAQAFGEEEETPPPPAETTATETVAPAPAPAPAATVAAAPAGEVTRPTIKSFGIGFGWIFPDQDIKIPNTVSARFMLTPVLTLEPSVTLALNGTTEELPGDVTNEASGFDFLVGGTGRLTLAQRYKVDFQLLATAALGYTSSTDNPEGSDNTTESSALLFGVGWGLGLVYYPKPHWSISFDATNPLLTYTQTVVNPAGDDNTSTTSNYLVGAIWDPGARVMIHLYF